MILLLIGLLMVTAQAAAGESPVRYYNPSWSPDGAQILFESNREGRFALYTVRLDGSGLERLTDVDADSEQPEYSPDGTRIAFAGNRSGHLQTFVMNADGTDLACVTTGDDEDYGPTWFPTGSMLVVMSRKPKTFVHNLVLIDLDTMKRGAMTDSTTNDTDPMWSPDGKWVLYRSSAVDPDATTWQEWQKTVKPTEEIYILDVVEGTRFPITRAHGEAKPVGWINDLTAVTMLPGAEVDSLYTQWVKDVASGKLPAATGVGAVPHGARPPGLLAVSTAAYPSGSLVFAMEKNGESGIYIRGYQQTKNTPVIRGAPAPDPPKR